MSIAIVTGSGGLIGAESVKFFSKKFDRIVGIDNDSRQYFFGKLASVKININLLKKNIKNYSHQHIDIRNNKKIEKIFKNYKTNIKFILHCAAQPSHDWAAKEPFTDFNINAGGTLNILENMRKYSPDAKLAFLSTNKVYGDRPNLLPLIEMSKRYEISKKHKYFQKGIDETMSIDNSKHSLFGASKLAADIYCQEYIKYFNWVENWVDKYFFNKVSDTLLGIIFISFLNLALFRGVKKKKIIPRNIFWKNSVHNKIWPKHTHSYKQEGYNFIPTKACQ